MAIPYLLSNSTIAFDSFGDISLDNGDLVVKTNKKAVILQALSDFLQTSYGDYFFKPGLGANLDKHIGKGITQSLVKEIAKQLKDDIIAQGLLPASLFQVYALQSENTIQVRIILTEDETTLYLTFDPSVGVTLGH